MNEFGDYIKRVRDEKGLTLNQVALYAEISAAQLSRIETGKRGTPKPQTIEKIATALKVDYNELMKIAGYLNTETTSSALTKKDERDIAKKLESILGDLDNDSSLAFNGEPMDDHTRELVRAQIESNLRVAKELARKKFTPKKYQNNDND